MARVHRILLLLCTALALPACTLVTTFVCSDDAQCQGAHGEGKCQANGACSVPDMTCPSGQKYAEFSDSAGECVPGDAGTTTGDVTGTSGSTSGSTTDGTSGSTTDDTSGSTTDDTSGSTTDDTSGSTTAPVCGENPPPDYDSCPEACASCDGDLCRIDCVGLDACKAMTVQCPDGLDCVINCLGEAACADATLGCPSEHGCDLNCEGKDGCKDAVLNCGAGTCEVGCTSSPNSVCSPFTMQCGTNNSVLTCDTPQMEAVIQPDDASECSCEIAGC